MERRLSFSKKMKIYHDTKIPPFFIYESLPSFKIDYKYDWLLFLFYLVLRCHFVSCDF